MSNQREKISTTVLPTIMLAIILSVLCSTGIFGMLVFNLTNPEWDLKAKLVTAGFGVIGLLPGIFLFIVLERRRRRMLDQNQQN